MRKSKLKWSDSRNRKKQSPLVVKNLPDSLLIRLFPHSIDVTFDVGLSRYEVVSDTSFSFYVDYNQIKTNPASLKIEIERSPRHIKDLVFTPETVEYLIERKNNPMLKIGLTGGIGSGKSTIAKIIATLGYPVY